jgi:hypothetical protein
MRFPSAALTVAGQEIAACGDPPPVRHAIPLLRGAEGPVGELVIGLRTGESRLDTADERILALLAAPLDE